MSEQKKFYLTTPIYYVNARPHIGHAYTTIAADVIARRHRLLGDDTFLLTGTDEHGQKIERSATAAGIDPQQFTDQVAASFRSLWDRMGITYNKFIRTTDDCHKLGAQRLFTELYNRGHIYLSTYTGAYCVSDEAFVDLPVGTPCPDCGRLLEEVTEENFFFRLSAFQQPLIDLIESNQLTIQPDVRRNEVLSFLRGNVNTYELPGLEPTTEAGGPSFAPSAKGGVPSGASSTAGTSGLAGGFSPLNTHEQGGALAPGIPLLKGLAFSKQGTPYVPGTLKDLSISRSSFKWGIPVPTEVQQKAGATQPHIIYVWLDALTNYMSAIGYGSDKPEDIAKFEKYWPADLHLVGKEIIRFHCVYWPAFLMAAGIDLPKAITAHGWLLFEESKMSKSRGNIVRTETILDAFGTLCPPTPSSIAEPTQNTVILSEASQSHREAESKDPERLDSATTAETFPPKDSALLKGTASAVPQSSASENAALAAEVHSPSKPQQDLFASDVLRYFLLREIPFGQDGSFSFDALVQRYNSDLANGYGNLVSRTLKLISQNLEEVVGKPVEPWLLDSPEQAIEKEPLRNLAQQIVQTGKIVRLLPNVDDISRHYQNSRFDLLITEISARTKAVDIYISSHEPWKLAKSPEPIDRAKMIEVLYTAAESIRIITALLYPILPYATAKVWSQLGLGSIETAAKNGELKNLQWGGLKPGTKLGPLAPIFPRADKGLIQIMTDMEVANNPAKRTEPEAAKPAESAPSVVAPAVVPEPAPEATPQIAIDDFTKIDLRVAQILVAERIPKADKLLRLEVDLGTEKRQILSGIAEWYTPEELIGRKILVIANLAPRKMRGLESHGMLLAASHGENGKPILATFGEDIAPGSRLK